MGKKLNNDSSWKGEHVIRNDSLGYETRRFLTVENDTGIPLCLGLQPGLSKDRKGSANNMFIAMLRKLFTIMRSMLINNQEF